MKKDWWKFNYCIKNAGVNMSSSQTRTRSGEPKRLWRRYIIEDMPFFKLVWKQKRGKYKDPFG